MRTKPKWKLSGGLCFLVFCLFVIGLFFVAWGNGAATAFAATSTSAVYTTQGKIESKGNVIADAPTEFYEVTMESRYASGTGTLSNHTLLDWTYATFKVNVKDHGHTEHTRYTLTRDGEVVSSGAMSGRSSTTICSTELTNGVYELTYVSTYWTTSETFTNYPYVFHFTIDNQAPTYQLQAGGIAISSGDTIAKNLTYSVTDEHLDSIYYKSPSANLFTSTKGSSFTVEAKVSNSGWWQFYAIDTLGQRTETVKAYMDCNPPQMTLANNMSFGTTVGQDIKVTASDEVGAAKLYVKYESEEWFSSGNTYTIPKTERNGRYYFYAVDDFGNRSETTWIVLSTEDPVGKLVKSDTDNSMSFVWDNKYWSATLDGSAYKSGTWVKNEGNHNIVLSNNAEKQKTYTFSVEHYYTVVEEKDANCKESGWKKYKCSQCGETYTETVYPKGHQFGVETTPATCTEQGVNKYTCSVCGYSYEELLGLPTGHDYTSVIITEATCTEDGLRRSTCDNCGHTYDTKIKAHGHTYEITDMQTSDGFTTRTYTCRECGDSYTQEIGNQYEEVSNYVEYLFQQYSPYMIWVFLATAGVWSIAIGVAIILAHKNEDKEKAKKMLVNYVIGLVVIFAILVACPYLIRGIAVLVTS